ncbi:MAG: MarR family transcriptional regulator [Longibaculum muris]|uniref:MarR family transcriptional regulator n=1 Tax=Longibaculum muris TaxID=1796628 RepID=UPI0029624771|nr:MarR family transcriptional regulator [Longibaculum muris]MED9811631.1 MarR family transcriptional regulator [Longibaculum muris]
MSLFCRLNTHIKRNFPIHPSEKGILIYLVKTNEEKTPNTVAKFFNVTKAMSTNMVTSLLSKGFIQKRQSKEDKHSYILVHTKNSI